MSLLGLLGSTALPALAAGPAASAPKLAEARPRWSELSPSQREALKPLERDWSGIDATRKQKWLEIAVRMPSMAALERERIQARMTEWAKLSPMQRSQARLQFQEAKQVEPRTRQDRWTAYQALTEEERRKLAERATPPANARREGPRVAATSNPKVKSDVASGAASGRPAASTPKLVAPNVVQARPGATTTLLSRKAPPPAHVHPGTPKIAATPGAVDGVTLLPRRGPQATTTRSASAAGSAPPP